EFIGLKDVGQFVFDFGDGEVIIGDSITNTKYWTGEGFDGIIKKWYRINGTFNARLTVTSKFGCSESYQYKAAATNIKLRPEILADKDSSCTSDPETCFRLKNGAIPGAKFLWNFGDPPSGPQNTNNKTWTPCHNYGGGPWMISLRIVSGPCDIMIYDTILKVGPSSTIEVPFNRVPQYQKYQCQIIDTVCFPNNSTFYHDDPNVYDEDSFFYYFPFSFRVVTHPVTLIDSIYTYQSMDTFLAKHDIGTVFQQNGYKAYYDATEGKWIVIKPAGDTARYDADRGGFPLKRRYVFNFDPITRAGDQTAIPVDPAIRNKDYVIRIWSFGDNFAPQCTTNTKANQNVGLNCNYSYDSLPCHWYTPWDSIYKYDRNGQRFKNPAPKTEFSKNARICYRVNIYAKDTVIVPQEVVLFVPFDSTKTFVIPYDSFGTQKFDSFTVVAGQTYPESQWMHNIYRLKIWRPQTVYYGKGSSTVIWEDHAYKIPAGVTIVIRDLGNSTTRTVSGPKIETIDKDEEFFIQDGDSVISISEMVVNDADTVIASQSQVIIDTFMNGRDTFIYRMVTLIDSAFHRDYFYQNTAQCNSVTLWHKDTVHPFMCESANNISLALTPPNARGLKWESGIPCPLDGNKLQYYLEFDMGETKPGCTQQWFEVNYDSLTCPTCWNPYNAGNVFAPPPPGLPIPFVLPYDIAGAWGTKFVKGYSAGEIGTLLQRPNGSFTIGLIVANGPPAFDGAGNPIAPECRDTAWYTDMFRYRFLDADFDILIPDTEPRTICAGETAYFRLLNPIQDSISALRWNWGYPDRLSGYYEEFYYWQPYTGPVKGRTDENVDWKSTDEWLYNFVIRHNLDEVFGDETIDTLVTRVYREWTNEINTYQADKIVSELLKSLDLDIRDITGEELALMLGDGTYGCIDTTGLSEYFVISKKSITDNVVKHGKFTYKYTSAAQTDSVIIEESLHFRDSSLQGYDTLIAPYTLTASDGTVFRKGDKIPGIYKFTYRHADIKLNFCDPSKKDTIWKNSNGPMVPGLFINNRIGCEKSAAKLLNVGYLNLFKFFDDAVCEGQELFLYDSIRYWQYGDQTWPDDYPIDPTKYWEDADRYIQNREIKEVNWDYGDPKSEFDRSIAFSHVYDKPGEYLVAIATRDSMLCRDTAFVTAFVTGVRANFLTSQQNGGDPCVSIISFFDSSFVMDPCTGRDTCPNGNYDPCDWITGYEWDFGDGSKRSVLENPAHDYTSNGIYTVTLRVFSQLGCEDTISKQIYIAGAQPGFEFAGFNPWGLDSTIICVGGTVNIDNTSRDPMDDPDFELYWGDGSTDSDKDPDTQFKHQYNTEGVYYLSMYMVDVLEGTNIKCGRWFPDTSSADGKIPRRIKVIVRPIAPSKLLISDTIVCPDEIVTFTSESDTIYKYFTWEFGDGDTALRNLPINSVNHSYSDAGSYMVIMTPDYDLPPGDFGPRCQALDTGYVTVIDVTADFDVDSTDKPEFCFTSTSQGASSYQWIIETPTRDLDMSYTSEKVCYNWGETIGMFQVCLIAISPEGCADTLCKMINNNFVAKITPYNVFTPDSDDDLNKTYIIDVEGQDSYEIVIYNRWGELVYKSEDATIGWDGTVMNKGSVKCPGGTYFYIINYKLKNRPENDNLEPISGTVTLIR
ncbi:MAG: gliding motility-associated-like protein, partial [Bacteroidia bacterium]